MDKDFWNKVEYAELKRFNEILGDSFKKFEGMTYDEVITNLRENHLRLLKERKVYE